MNYARVENGKVVEIIPAIDPNFPEIPVQDRFHKSIIDQLVEIPEDLAVEQHWNYTKNNGFIPPIVETEIIEEEN